MISSLFKTPVAAASMLAVMLVCAPPLLAQTEMMSPSEAGAPGSDRAGNFADGWMTGAISWLSLGWLGRHEDRNLAAIGTVPPVLMPSGIVPPSSAVSFEPDLLRRLVAAESPARPTVTLEYPNFTAPAQVTGSPITGERGLVGRAVDSVGYFFSYLWSGITAGLTPPSPASFAKTFEEKDPYSFWYLLGETGYKLKEIDSDVGLIPDVAFKFKYVRELSNGDITYLERKLERHARKYSDMLSVVQRSIIYSLLEINNSETYFVDTFKVKLLPLPKAEFTLEPWESGLPEEFDVLLRAIQGKEVHYRRMGRDSSDAGSAGGK